jgi:hypothetical protein
MKRGLMMQEHMTGPLPGVIAIVALTIAVTLGCFVAMFRMLLRPGETDRRHPKYGVLDDDR